MIMMAKFQHALTFFRLTSSSTCSVTPASGCFQTFCNHLSANSCLGVSTLLIPGLVQGQHARPALAMEILADPNATSVGAPPTTASHPPDVATAGLLDSHRPRCTRSPLKSVIPIYIYMFPYLIHHILYHGFLGPQPLKAQWSDVPCV